METHLSYHEPGKELDKNSRKLGMGEENFNSIKSIYTKHTDDLIFNGERLNSLSLLLRTRELCPISPPALNIIVEILGSAIRQKYK